jgi:hypothetical protein
LIHPLITEWEGAMWKVEDALAGRLSVGQAEGQSGDSLVTITLPRRRAYQLQKLLEELAEKSTAYFDVRMAVVLAETVRVGLVKTGDGDGQTP